MAKIVVNGIVKVWMKIIGFILSLLGVSVTMTSCMYEPSMYSPAVMYGVPYDGGYYKIDGKVTNSANTPINELSVLAWDSASKEKLSEGNVTYSDGTYNLSFYDNSEFTDKKIFIQVFDVDGVKNGSYQSAKKELTITKTKNSYTVETIILKDATDDTK